MSGAVVPADPATAAHAAGEPDLNRRLFAEFLGSALLAAMVVGSGIAAQRLSPGAVGLELLENVAAIVTGLYALIVVFGPLSAHFNPVVSVAAAWFGSLRWREAGWFAVAQVAGCCLGAMLANAMFGLRLVTMSTTSRMSGAHGLGEVVATFGLMLVIFALSRSGRSSLGAAAVAAYFGAAAWFTSSAAFANPALTVARMLSDTFTGIAPASVPLFVLAQAIGGVAGVAAVTVLFPRAAAERYLERSRFQRKTSTVTMAANRTAEIT